MPTKIQWCDETWNVVSGCTKIAAGCVNCYAERLCYRFWKQWNREPPPNHFKVKLHPDRLDQPRKWKKPRRVFVCSMGDLFHKDVPGYFLSFVFDTMRTTPWHTYLVLTKRPDLMGAWCNHDHAPINVHLGVSVSTQADADRMLPELLSTPAAVRFVSVEPMLERIDIHRYVGGFDYPYLGLKMSRRGPPYLNWVIIGCESGPHRRHVALDDMIDVVRQCKDAGVPVFVKQVEIDGKVSHDPAEWPEELRMREYPD